MNESNDQLVERVRAALNVGSDVSPDWNAYGLAALTELAERLKALEKERDVLFKGDWAALNLKLEAAERERDEARNLSVQLGNSGVKARAQRDALVEALRAIEHRTGGRSGHIRQIARAALAKVES